MKPTKPYTGPYKFLLMSKDQEKILRRLWRRGRLLHWLGNLFRLVGAALLALVVGLHILFTGPSQTVCDMLTMSLTESSALKFVPYVFLRDEQVREIFDRCAVQEPEEKVDPSLITIPVPEDLAKENGGEDAASAEPIVIEYVSGGTYKGQVMIVQDPSRVFLGVTNEHFSTAGIGIDKMVEKYGAVGGINASGFKDDNGNGNGGTPLGTIISEGKVLRSDTSKTIAAFDNNNILHVGKFDKAQAEALGLRDGAGWGPALIVNGVPAEIDTDSTGLNPRTGIGQRADGAVILVTLDGRHASSLGGTYKDLIDIFIRYGAVNACNLDGGYSSIMYYQGERVSKVTDMTRTRRIPTAFLIKGVDEE